MRILRVALAAIVGLCCCQAVAKADVATAERLVKEGKAHRMTVFQGSAREVYYAPLAKLSAEELAALRAAENTVNNEAPKILQAQFEETAAARPATIYYAHQGVIRQIEGMNVKTENGWLVFQQNDRIERIPESLVVRISEPAERAAPVAPAVIVPATQK